MFRKLMPVAKKPWAKDVTKKKKTKEPELTSDAFRATEDTTATTTDHEDYEYYDDHFFHNSPSRSNVMMNDDSSKMMSTRFSNIMDLKQALLYFDYKLSNRNLGGGESSSPKSKRAAPRMSTGIVPTAAMPELPRRGREARPTAGSQGRPTNAAPSNNSKNRFNSILSVTSSIKEATITEEDEEDESDDEDLYTDNKIRLVRVRSLSPAKKAPATASSSAPTEKGRPRLVKRSSWTSSRDIKEQEPEPKPKARKKTGTDTKGKKKKKEGGAGGAESSPTLKKKKKKVPGSDSDMKPTNAGGSNGKIPKPARKRLQRNNSWTSSRGLDTEGISPKSELMGGDRPFSDKKLDKTERKSSKEKNSDVSPKEELRAIINAPKPSKGPFKGPRLPHGVNIMEHLKKTKDFCTSMAHLTKKDFDKEEVEHVQEQLAEALAQVEQLSIEQEKAMAIMESATTEVDELKIMLAESAKENNEMHDRLELIQSEMDDGQSEIERYKQNFETVLEEKNALADDLNQTEVELRTLRSRMKRTEARASVSISPSGPAMRSPSTGSTGGGLTRNVSILTGLQNNAFETQVLAKEQAELLEEKDRKIEELEKRIIDGGGEDAEKAIRLFEELETLKKEHKRVQLDSSVQLAKKDAMIARLQSSAADERLEMQTLVDAKKELERELKIVKAQLALAEEGVEKCSHLKEKVKKLEQRVVDAETVEKGLQNAIDKWTDKTFEWKEKAETLEIELIKLKKGDENGQEEQPKQAWGLF